MLGSALVGALALGASVQASTPNKVARADASGTSSGSLPTITTKGNAFFAGDKRFYIRGVDYQPGGSSGASDPLADFDTCSRDIAKFKELGLNSIRVYTVDNTANHDQCMQALSDAGIYLALDVNTPNYSLNRGSSDAVATSYNPTYLQNVFATIDAFAGYSNTLLFFSGNEVINAPNTTSTAPYIKAVTRDMKQYIVERGYRSIPVGYSAADVAENQYLMAEYVDCGEEQTRSDFYAINNYEWCAPSSYTTSGWSALVELYSNYSIPLFFSEFGCIKNTRTFEEVNALYQSDMTKVFSGGLIYEYSDEGNGYGIVKIDGTSVNQVGSQFDDLKSAFAGVSDPSDGGGYTTSSTVQTCPDQSTNWDTSPFEGSALPAMPSGAEDYLKNGAGKGFGLSGDGSQNAPGGSAETASAGAGQATATNSGGSSPSSGLASPRQMGAPDVAPIFIAGLVTVFMSVGAMLL